MSAAGRLVERAAEAAAAAGVAADGTLLVVSRRNRSQCFPLVAKCLQQLSGGTDAKDGMMESLCLNTYPNGA